MFAGGFAVVLEELHVEYALAAGQLLSHKRGLGGGGGRDKGLSPAAQRPAVNGTFQRYFHPGFLNPVHLFLDFPLMPNKGSLIIKSDWATWGQPPFSERSGPSYFLPQVLVNFRVG